MAATYPIIANCNFESRDDDTGRWVYAAAKAAKQGLVSDDLLDALDALEETLTEYADDSHVAACTACRAAEERVADLYVEESDSIEAKRIARY